MYRYHRPFKRQYTLNCYVIFACYLRFIFHCRRNKRKRSLEGGLGGPENDDFTPVGGTESTSRKAGAPRSRKTKTGKKSTELKNFYRFQIKEEKIKELDSLRKKFAEDQLRVAKMKELRKFKPF